MNNLEVHKLDEITNTNKLKIYFLYINNSDLNIITSEDLFLNDEYYIDNNILIDIINKHKIHNQKKYHINSIMKFNINIKDKDILNTCLTSNIDYDNYDQFLIKENYTKNIYFNNMSYLFEDINSLFFIYKRVTSDKSINLTKKNTRKNNNNKTRKII